MTGNPSSRIRPRVFTAPGESPDLLESVRSMLEVEEIDSLARIGSVDPVPTVLFMSRSLLAGMGPGEWATLPAHVAVIASDADARRSAEGAGRLFLSMEDFRSEFGSLDRLITAAGAYSAALLEGIRWGAGPEPTNG